MSDHRKETYESLPRSCTHLARWQDRDNLLFITPILIGLDFVDKFSKYGTPNPSINFIVGFTALKWFEFGNWPIFDQSVSSSNSWSAPLSLFRFQEDPIHTVQKGLLDTSSGTVTGHLTLLIFYCFHSSQAAAARKKHMIHVRENRKDSSVEAQIVPIYLWVFRNVHSMWLGIRKDPQLIRAHL